jgi:hypothetical protein
MPTPIITPTTQSLTTQKVDVIAEFQALVDGINSLLTGIDPFILLGQTVSRADLLAKLQARIDAALKTKNDRKLVAADVAAEKGAAAIANPLRRGVKAFAISQFGDTSPKLQELGFVPHRTPKRKPKNVAAGAMKAKATRKTRGTKGKQQRAAASQAAEAAVATTAAPVQAAPAEAPVAPAPHGPVAGGSSNQGSSS